MNEADDDKILNSFNCKKCGRKIEVWKSELAWACCNTFDCECGLMYNSFGQQVLFHVCSDFPPPEFDPDYAGEEW